MFETGRLSHNFVCILDNCLCGAVCAALCAMQVLGAMASLLPPELRNAADRAGQLSGAGLLLDQIPSVFGEVRPRQRPGRHMQCAVQCRHVQPDLS